MVLGTVLRGCPKHQRANAMTDGHNSVMMERQRGFLGAFLLMLALVVGQFVTLERKISFRSAADPAVSRAAADKASDRPAPRPLSAGGGSGSSDNWHMAANGSERRAVKAKTAGGGDPFPAAFLPEGSRPAAFPGLFEVAAANPAVIAVPPGTPGHHFDGRAPPQRVL